MENNENEWYRNQDGDGKSDASAQVPSSLLPTVLYRLGLTSEPASSETPVESLVARLKSENWEERASAVRALGKLGKGAPVEELMPALQDEDASVRAAVVHVLGILGKRVPLHLLIVALSDADWHVRETAVLALGKQGQRVPREVLMTVLHDTDTAVRDAARIALRQYAAEESTSALYGALWEQKTMQHDQENHTLANGKDPSEKMPIEGLEGSFLEYKSAASQPHVLREQTQGYAPQQYEAQESSSYEYEVPLSARGEKVTSFPLRRSLPKGWWAILAIVALLFFILGRMTIGVVEPTSVPMPPGVISVAKEQSVGDGIPFGKIFTDPRYTMTLQQEVASALRLTPDNIRMQLKAGKSLTDIAKAQSVSQTQLQDIEMKAFTGTVNDAVKAGDLDSKQAGALLQSIQDNPLALDKLTVTAFLTGFRSNQP